MSNKKEYKFNIKLNVILMFIFLVLSFFVYVIYSVKIHKISVINKEEYVTIDNNYKLVVEMIREDSIIPFELENLRFVLAKKVENKWIYKNAFEVPFEYSIHRNIKYDIKWINDGVMIKTIAEKQDYSRIYRIYFEDLFQDDKL